MQWPGWHRSPGINTLRRRVIRFSDRDSRLRVHLTANTSDVSPENHAKQNKCDTYNCDCVLLRQHRGSPEVDITVIHWADDIAVRARELRRATESTVQERVIGIAELGSGGCVFVPHLREMRRATCWLAIPALRRGGKGWCVRLYISLSLYIILILGSDTGGRGIMAATLLTCFPAPCAGQGPVCSR